MTKHPTIVKVLVSASAACLALSGCSGSATGDGREVGLPTPDVQNDELVESSGLPISEVNMTASDAVDHDAPAPPARLEVVEEADSVLAIIAEHPDLTTFAQLVAAYPQQQVFTQARGVTIFVPNDAAFEEMGPDAVAELASDHDAFTLLLSAHMAIGTYSLESVSAAGGFSTALANELVVAQSDGATTIGAAVVQEHDLVASNGVIHVIDAPAS